MSEFNTPTNYHDFRKRFLDGVNKLQLQLHSIQVRGLSPQGKPLFTDIAHNVINPQLPTMVHITGCHGIEGYIGSTIQASILEMDNFPIETFNKMNLVFVHALNPYGMSWYRRVNAHNVDLNRNYFRDDQERPANLDFDTFAPLFERRPAEKKWKIWKKIILFFFREGLRQTTEAIAKGQYHQPESIFYGGTSIEPEVHETLHVLQKILKGCQKLYILDVHSGLGKFGSENWILDGNQTENEELFWRLTLETQLINPVTDESVYKANGTFGDAFRGYFPTAHLFYIFEEFGTQSALTVLRALIKEHKTFLKLKLDRMRAFLMLATFFPYEKGWRINCLAAGKQSFFKVVQAISQSKVKE